MSVKMCEIVSNLQTDDGETLFDMDALPEILARRSPPIIKYCYIIHNQDTYTKKESEKNPEKYKEGELKPAHIHLLLRFNSPQQYKAVGKWFGIEENFVSKITGNWESSLAYQIHLNSPEKHQYSPDEVTANFDYVAALEKIGEKENRDEKVKELVDKILDGEIREYNKTLEIDNMLLVDYAYTFDTAFKVRSERMQATVSERQTEVIFITGKAGVGKTTLAKKIAKERGLDFFISSGSNDVMDGYGQQPCLILDDIRPSALGLSDLLKLLDNNTASSIKSRYKNKYLNCELVILTTVLSIDKFYSNVFENENEPVTQLKRRCGTYIVMDSENIYIRQFDTMKMAYSDPVICVNDIIDGYRPAHPLTREDVKANIAQSMPFLTFRDTAPQAAPEGFTKVSGKEAEQIKLKFEK
ncbi:MAG: AAA family ATPase [Lachnospiraceae bacterium]|nr:AAA family ATPase [Lachnospiraceae bacterium]